MAYDLNRIRLFVQARLSGGEIVELSTKQQHYLKNVMRLAAGDEVGLFNGRDGEWRSELVAENKRGLAGRCLRQTAAQPAAGKLAYLFAPLKAARLDYMAQKACEMGAAILQPVRSERTVPARLNRDRLRANAVEAAEQCGILAVPEIGPFISLNQALDDWPADRPLIWCDELAERTNPLDDLAKLEPGALGLLVGPEGGFSDRERAKIMSHKAAFPISLGPRILRADTAAVAALALIQARLGDWRAV
jgi:16S rRNA (uracil1498-N3)-methyltransferase